MFDGHSTASLNGVKYAVDYLRTNFLAEKLNNLPFTTLLVPLSVFFAWFWRASFSKRYSSAVLRNLNVDIEQMRILRDRGDSNLGEFAVEISTDFFMLNTFGFNNVNTKTFVLLLASQKPLSFISGQPVDLARTLKEANRTEFHHLMPRAFLKSGKDERWADNVLANFTFLSRADNREIGGAAPSVYRTKMPTDIAAILKSAVASEALFTDDFVGFMSDRADRLATIAASLCETTVIKSRSLE
jgi:hypothetical protein